MRSYTDADTDTTTCQCGADKHAEEPRCSDCEKEISVGD
jgi:hypothetical protein